MLKRTLLIAALSASVVTFSPTSRQVWAADPAPDAASLEEAKKHFAAGQKAFDGGDLKGAVEEFKESYKLSKNALLLYNIGFVYDKLDDSAMAIHYYEKYIIDAPDNPKTHERHLEVEGRIIQLKRNAKNGESPTAGEPAATEPTPAPTGKGKKPAPEAAPVTGFVHEAIDEAPPGRPVDIVVQVPQNSGWTATLFFRGAGEETFSAIVMKPHYSELVGRIPAGAMKGTSVHYYVEAKDGGGKLVGNSGKAGSPNIIYLDANAKPHFFADDSEAAPIASGPGKVDAEESPLGGGENPIIGNNNNQHANGPADTGKSNLGVYKWTATGGAVVFLGVGMAFYFTAKSYSSTLEGEASASSSECPTPPCRAYTQNRKDLESTGQRFQTFSRVGMVLGGAAAITAGVLWYMDSKHDSAPAKGKEAPSPRVTAAPFIGDGVFGGAAQVTF